MRRACITGTGRSSVGRSLLREPVDLAIEACLNAVDDAGLTLEDIDGLAAHVPDQGCANIADLQDALGIGVKWYIGSAEGGASQLASLWDACFAVEAGVAKHVLCFHASAEGSIRARLGRGGSLPGTGRGMPERGTGAQGWWLPFGAPSVANIVAMYAARHFHEFGTTREQLAQIALVQRENALLNNEAVYREPLSMDQYLNARMVSEPLCLFDCDVPVDFGCAVVVSASDVSSSLRRPPIVIQARSTARTHRPSWEQGEDLSTMMALGDAGRDLWSRTDLTPEDVDVAGIYDGFSFIALAWIEALGFCGRGEGGAFIEGGHRIALDGELPINPHGGQLSAGRTHGWAYLPEVCAQLWGESGARQVRNEPRVGLVATGGGIIGAAALLVRD